jgi:hypothetical protein
MSNPRIGARAALGVAALCLCLADVSAQPSGVQIMQRRNQEETRHESVVASLDARKRAENDRHKQMLQTIEHAPTSNTVPSKETLTQNENQLHDNLLKEIARERAIEDRQYADNLAAIGGGGPPAQAPSPSEPGVGATQPGTAPPEAAPSSGGNAPMLQGNVTQTNIPAEVGAQGSGMNSPQPRPVLPLAPETTVPQPVAPAPRPPVVGPQPTRVSPQLPPFVPVQPVLTPAGSQPSQRQVSGTATVTAPPQQPPAGPKAGAIPSYPPPAYVREHLFGSAWVPIPGSSNSESISIDVPSDFPVGGWGPGTLTQNEPNPYYVGYYGQRDSAGSFVITRLEDKSGRWLQTAQPIRITISEGTGQ